MSNTTTAPELTSDQKSEAKAKDLNKLQRSIFKFAAIFVFGVAVSILGAPALSVWLTNNMTYALLSESAPFLETVRPLLVMMGMCAVMIGGFTGMTSALLRFLRLLHS